MKHPIHPFAELFPMMDECELKDLAADIKKNGLRGAITLFDGKVLDGRNRYLACDLAGVDPKFREHKDGDPLAFVLSANLHRRHLTTSQRAMVAASLSKLTHGGDRKSDEFQIGNQDANLHLDRSKAAKTLDVSPRSVATASKLQDESPKLSK